MVAVTYVQNVLLEKLAMNRVIVLVVYVQQIFASVSKLTI